MNIVFGLWWSKVECILCFVYNVRCEKTRIHSESKATIDFTKMEKWNWLQAKPIFHYLCSNSINSFLIKSIFLLWLPLEYVHPFVGMFLLSTLVIYAFTFVKHKQNNVICVCVSVFFIQCGLLLIKNSSSSGKTHHRNRLKISCKQTNRLALKFQPTKNVHWRDIFYGNWENVWKSKCLTSDTS